jgi:hypothetical protein
VDTIFDNPEEVKTMIEMIQQSAIPHDRYQIELKLDYELGKGKNTHYSISTYIFIPSSLGISEANYPKSDFYRDVKNYIRIKTPELSLRDLTESDISPLKTIHQIVQRPNWYQDEKTNEQIIRALKLFGAMFKSSLREHLNLVELRIKTAPSAETRIDSLVDNLIEEFISQSKQISAKYRALYAEFNLPSVKKDVFLAYTLVDEYLSLLVDESATELFKFVSQDYKGPGQATYLRKLNKIVEKETDHRLSRGYGSILKPNDANENYAFRASVLKKYVASVLYLATDAQREGKGVEQFLLALAAGISMVFATLVAFYFQSIYGNFTFPVFVALVVGYMFKDRIKESIRAILSDRLHARLYDRRINIKTLDGKYKLAVLREKISFIQESEVSETVLAARHKDPFADLDNEGRGETIICHTKDIILYADLFQKVFEGLPKVSGLNDIIRYDIHPYLRKMDDPFEEQSLLENGELKTVQICKVYHLNFVSRYQSVSPKIEKTYRYMRLVLNRQGIIRIENVDL